MDETAAARRHTHHFNEVSEAAARSTRQVVWITAAMMVVEVGVGLWSNSMALLADGLHMSSHAVAIGVSALAYAMAKRLADDPSFAFGTFKIEILGGFASAVFLMGVAIMMVVGSIERLLAPAVIHYPEAIVVAIIGLAVNAACALILGHAHTHGHDHGHDHGHGHGHHHHDHDHDHAEGTDLNLRSAYLHVIADALTSVLAIAALLAGLFLDWAWLDPLMGVVGAVLVASWARGLIRDTGRILLDREMLHPLVAEIPTLVAGAPASGSGAGAGSGEAAGAAAPARIDITDLHLWRVGKEAFACELTLVTDDTSLDADTVRQRLSARPALRHVTIEIHHVSDDSKAVPAAD